MPELIRHAHKLDLKKWKLMVLYREKEDNDCCSNCKHTQITPKRAVIKFHRKTYCIQGKFMPAKNNVCDLWETDNA